MSLLLTKIRINKLRLPRLYIVWDNIFNGFINRSCDWFHSRILGRRCATVACFGACVVRHTVAQPAVLFATRARRLEPAARLAFRIRRRSRLGLRVCGAFRWRSNAKRLSLRLEYVTHMCQLLTRGEFSASREFSDHLPRSLARRSRTCATGSFLQVVFS